MSDFSLLSIVPIDFSFTALLHEHNLIFIFAILGLYFSVIFFAVKTFALQSALLLVFFVVTENFSSPLYLALVVMQIALSLWILWQLKLAIDYKYNRVCEKTHKMPRNITKGGNPGTHRILF